MTFTRQADKRLLDWYERPSRKPLVLRGARQTGKTTAVRRLGQHAPLYLELNLERPEDLALAKTCHSASELLERLQQDRSLSSLPAGTLLFLDEIQELPIALGWLRFLHEDHKDLSVVAAGSLLEVRLRDDPLPFPVGRVEFERVEPLTYLEFLEATGDDRIAEDLRASFATPSGPSEGLHELAMARFRTFLIVGGLPEAVETWRQARELVSVRRVHSALRQAYSEDLLKYRVHNTQHLEALLQNAPAFFGSRYKLRHLAPGGREASIAKALDLLERAMVLFSAAPTSNHKLPLIARPRAARKLLPLDMGLALAQLEVRPEQLAGQAIETLMGGRLAEAFVGLQLLAREPSEPRSLSFWTREGSAKSNAEVDYLLPTREGVLPVEVKSGSSGSLKSLHQYLSTSGTHLGFRLWAACGGTEELTVKLTTGVSLDYELRTLPIYLAELLPDWRRT